MKLRIPGWANQVEASINDLPVTNKIAAGSYLELKRRWKSGDCVSLLLDMPARLIQANPLVEEDLNQVAVQRGPVVYCVESVDLPAGKGVLDCAIPPDINLVSRYDSRMLGGSVVIEGRAELVNGEDWNGKLYQDFQRRPGKPFNLRFIPYCLWENRGASEMSVWIPLGDRLAGK